MITLTIAQAKLALECIYSALSEYETYKNPMTAEKEFAEQLKSLIAKAEAITHHGNPLPK